MRTGVRAPLLAAALLAAAAPATAQRVTTPQVAVADGRILVSFSLEGGFDERLREHAASGLPTGFVYEIELLRDRKRWWDDLLAAGTLEVAAMYNAVAGEYLVNFKHDGRLVESRLARTLAELEVALTRFEQFPAFPLTAVERRGRLLVRVRADLGPRTLLSFVPTRLTTDWRESRKFTAPPP